ncbi:MAG: glycosyltransferase [Akkermansia sp.]|nr:glycosyltransferase [Akkermansia sp.]
MKKRTDLPLVTVITVTYNLLQGNRAEQLKKCISSVHSQIYPNIEHLFIDGASTDGTLELLKEYEKTHFIKCYSEPDAGIYDAMNKGIAKANGKYCVFLNSDDYWHDTRGVAATVRVMESANADMSYGKIRYITEDDQLISINYPELGCFFATHPFCHQTVFTRTDVLKEFGGFDTSFKMLADYDLICRILLGGKKAAYVPLNFTSFRRGGFSTAEETRILTVTERTKCHTKYFGEFWDENKLNLLKEGIIPADMPRYLMGMVHPSVAIEIQRCIISLPDGSYRIVRGPEQRMAADNRSFFSSAVKKHMFVDHIGCKSELEKIVRETCVRLNFSAEKASISSELGLYLLNENKKKIKSQIHKFRFLSHILWGKKRKYYRDKKRELKKILQELSYTDD